MSRGFLLAWFLAFLAFLHFLAFHNTGQYSHVGWLVYLLANLNKSNNANTRHVNDFVNAIKHSGKKKSASIVMACHWGKNHTNAKKLTTTYKSNAIKNRIRDLQNIICSPTKN